MSEQSPHLVAPYSALAAVYEQAGLADDTSHLVPRLIEHAQRLDWAGRRILDLGCGTGASSRLLAALGYRVSGIDSSEAMLSQAGAVGGDGHEPPAYHLMDVRELESPIGPVDLALMLGGVLNALPSLRDVERAFGRVAAALAPGKPFIVDVRTIRGLAQDAARAATTLAHDAPDLLLVRRNRFAYETLSATYTYSIFERQGEDWQRSDEVHVERGYPVQAISALLGRQGFENVEVLDAGLRPFEADVDTHGRAVFVAWTASG